MVVAVLLLDSTAAESGGPRLAVLRGAFGDGWWLGFGYFVAGFWWLSAAFLIDPDFTWALPLGVLGLPALLALFFGAGFVLARLLWVPGPGARARAGARPRQRGMGARAPLHGIPLEPARHGARRQPRHGAARRAGRARRDDADHDRAVRRAGDDRRPARPAGGAWRPALVAFRRARGDLRSGAACACCRPPRATSPASWCASCSRGCGRTASSRRRTATGSSTITSRCRNSDDAAKHVALSDVTMLVWPESPFPFILTRDPFELAKIGAMLPAGTSLVTGAAREVDVPAGDGHAAYSDYYNAMLVIVRGGAIVDDYDKVHLVPFGEYLPFDRLFRAFGLRNFVAVPGGFEFGAKRQALAIPGMPIRRAADLLRGDLPRRGAPGVEGRRATRGSCSTSPTTAGSATRAVRTSTSRRRACARSRKGCRWSGARRRASRRSSIPTDASASQLAARPGRDHRWPPAGHHRFTTLCVHLGGWATLLVWFATILFYKRFRLSM